MTPACATDCCRRGSSPRSPSSHAFISRSWRATPKSEARPPPLDQPLPGLAELARILQRAMLEDALASLEAQVEAVKCRIALFQQVDDTQRLQVVLESAMRFHAVVQCVLAGMAERRVTEVVRERDRLDQVFVESQAARDRARDLCNLEAVGEARAEQIAFVIDEDLGLIFETAKCSGVNNAVAVALQLAAPHGRRFAPAPAAAVEGANRVARQLRHARRMLRVPRRARPGTPLR